MEKLKSNLDDIPFVLLGDFDDNPDDQSLNILETGDPNGPPGPEEIPGPYLFNLTEPLCAKDHVSHGLKSDAIKDDRVDTIDPGSRERNNSLRDTNKNTGDILFDQILIPGWMANDYVEGSCRVFDYAVAVKGNDDNRASDHVPVYAEFSFAAEGVTVEEGDGLRIAALLPNPDGSDDMNEQVTLRNPTQNPISLAGWKLKDRSGNEYAFSGSIPAQSSLMVTMACPAILNNSGDTVWLVDPQREKRSEVSYASAQARPGETVTFH